MNRSLEEELSQIIEGVSIEREVWIKELADIIEKAILVAVEVFDEEEDGLMREYSDDVICVDVKDQLDLFSVEIFPIMHGTRDPLEEGGCDIDQPWFSITIRPRSAWLEHLKGLPVATPV